MPYNIAIQREVEAEGVAVTRVSGSRRASSMFNGNVAAAEGGSVFGGYRHASARIAGVAGYDRTS